MSQYFRKKQKLSIQELKKRFEDDRFVDCVHIHDNGCFVEAFYQSIKSMLIFKKVYVFYFLLKLIPRIRKFKSIKDFLVLYWNFFPRSCLQIFIMSYIYRHGMCLLRNTQKLQKKIYFIFMVILGASSILVEKTSRAQSLSIFIFGPCIQTTLEHVYRKLNLNKEYCREKAKQIVYSITFGLTCNYLVNENKKDVNTMFKYMSKLLPVLDKQQFNY